LVGAAAKVFVFAGESEAVFVDPTATFVALATVLVLTGAGMGGKILLVMGNHAARNASETTIIMRDLRSIEFKRGRDAWNGCAR
jgi:hypothetical protein